ncbi:DUF349 domain-containing protein [Thalassotalea sp. PS06]|uniref:DUF349 domain-containing protein n=1 Tax=Thalassotalea sp. PS06 TaxID=2594005 RepID=UPI0011635DEB|nr:DUF349 domain-containing protein [Thalassotalea sp. PS06]QDP01288.1 DUF349 domain-containing protein [Thalassotalea sp. PS06]
MIFKKWRKAKWQHQDASVRLAAIDELVQQQDQQYVLLQLLREDPELRVQKKVLLAIESPELLLSIKEPEFSQSLALFAQQRIEAQLLSDNTYTEQQKLEFYQRIRPFKNQQKFILQWLSKDQNDAIALDYADVLDTDVALANLFQQINSVQAKLVIVDKVNDTKLLTKFLKNERETDVGEAITEKLTVIEERKTLPAKITKKAQLVLSKLLSLKDDFNASSVLEKYQMLTQEWHAVVNSFNALPDNEGQALSQKLSQKYVSVEQQLHTHLATMQEKHAHQQMLQQQELQKAQKTQKIKELLTELRKRQQQVIGEDSDTESLQTAVQELNLMLAEGDVEKSLAQMINAEVSKTEKLVLNLEEIRIYIVDATRLILELDNSKLPQQQSEFESAEVQYSSWSERWRKCQQLLGDWLPESVATAAQQLQNDWQQALKPFRKSAKEQQAWFNQKFSELERLIRSGKYRAAMAVYRKIQQANQGLSETAQTKIKEEFQSATLKIDELKSLESFVVVPRKQALIEQLQQLIDSPLPEIPKQAEKVKQYRKQWLVLGRAEGDMEGQFNQKFNKLCEQAFAPCREFYTQQASLRADNLKKKQLIIKQLQDLNKKVEKAESMQLNELSKHLNQLLVNWKEAGDVDRDKYKGLQNQFNQQVTPLKNTIRFIQDSNAEAKRDLIKKAEQYLDTQDFNKATAELKQLQQQWRSIGFSGGKEDNHLWKQFRLVNDQVFARRDEAKQQKLDENNQRRQDWLTAVNALKEQLKKASGKEVSRLEEQVKSLLHEVKTLDRDDKPLLKLISELGKSISKTRDNQRQLAKKSQFESVFTLIESLSDQTFTLDELQQDAQFLTLNKGQQRALLKAAKSDGQLQKRQTLTIEMEIISQIDSPAQDANLRKQIQVAMLKDKLNGADVDISDKLHQWLACGPVDKDQIQLLNRVKPIFL